MLTTKIDLCATLHMQRPLRCPCDRMNLVRKHGHVWEEHRRVAAC